MRAGGRLDEVWGGADAGMPQRIRRDPWHMLETVAELGLLAEDVRYVGDNPVDASVARAAGGRYRHVACGVAADDDCAS